MNTKKALKGASQFRRYRPIHLNLHRESLIGDMKWQQKQLSAFLNTLNFLKEESHQGFLKMYF